MKKILLLLLIIPIITYAATFETPPLEKPALHAERVKQPVVVDGILNETTWQDVNGYTYFTQRDPFEGKDPSQKTIVHLVYDEEALYIGARMFDSSPDSIVTRLGRRDQPLQSDKLYFYIDPYHDKRSGYYFGMNAAGTYYDGTIYNDVMFDDTWDGIWEGNASIDEQGWSVEMRIPFSQLRFQEQEQVIWAGNFARVIDRKKEVSYITFTPKNESGFVSRFVDLTGIEQIRPQNNLEVMPFVRSKAAFTHPEAANPFNDGSTFSPGTGLDLKYRLGSNLVLDMTMNPDFGQVEVDPAVVNLSAFETYFPEKRPFFVEGSSIFQFGTGGTSAHWGFSWSRPTFFYSRRIGRSPQRDLPDNDFADVPDNTNILGAAKITGKLAGNWNVGSIHAVTSREFADLDLNGERTHPEVEPQTYYGVFRAQKEIDDAKYGIGFLGTVVDRKFKEPALVNDVNKESYAFGIDGWSFLDDDREWVVSSWLGASHIKGSPERMLDVQKSVRHYFQRPDAKSYSLDSTATFMTGTAGRILLNKQKGNIMFNTAIGYIGPSFDVNDLGYMNRTDEINGHVMGGYRWTEPGKFARTIYLRGSAYYGKDADGNVTDKGLWHNGYFLFSNYYTLSYTFYLEDETINPTLTRGGPIMVEPKSWSNYLYISSDSRKSLIMGASTAYVSSAHDAWYFSLGTFAEWKARANLSLSFEPGMFWHSTYSQWVDAIDDPLATETYGKRYVYASIWRKQFSAGLRMSWTFTPKLSLQVFAQPLVSIADYNNFKEFAEPGTYEFNDLTDVEYDEEDNTLEIDPDGSGPADSFSFDNPDFDLKSLRGNAVLRWEYMPGSTMYLVWTQQRSEDEFQGNLDFKRSFERILSPNADNIFMLKVSYWLNI